MLIFAKDIAERDFQHSHEAQDPELKEYMDYQRKLFPYTVVRAGLDLAYKELDDILVYVDNDRQVAGDSQRQDYPDDVPGWFRDRFPWTASFMEMEDMHGLLVRLIKSMDSFRTWEAVQTCHWVVLYDAVHNIVNVYNDLIAANAAGARDIQLSSGVEVHFDDFINNYWPHLEFMILSRPDYPHTRLLERNQVIEDSIKDRLAEGLAPLNALEGAAEQHHFAEGTLPLLRRDALTPEQATLERYSLDHSPHSHQAEILPSDSPQAGMTRLEEDYILNFRSFRKTATLSK